MTRNIENLSSWLAYYFLDIEIDPKSFKIYKNLIETNIEKFKTYGKYFGKLHDSLIIKTEISTNNFSLILNDFTTHVFADAVIATKKIKTENNKLIFPLKLEFEINSLTFNTIDDNGKIQPIEKTNVSEYLYEQVVSINENNIELALIVWESGINNERGREILILVNAKTITIEENQNNAWFEIFGNSYDEYYKYFKSQFVKGRYLSDLSECLKLINEYDQMKTIPSS